MHGASESALDDSLAPLWKSSNPVASFSTLKAPRRKGHPVLDSLSFEEFRRLLLTSLCCFGILKCACCTVVFDPSCWRFFRVRFWKILLPVVTRLQLSTLPCLSLMMNCSFFFALDFWLFTIFVLFLFYFCRLAFAGTSEKRLLNCSPGSVRYRVAP